MTPARATQPDGAKLYDIDNRNIINEARSWHPELLNNKKPEYHRDLIQSLDKVIAHSHTLEPSDMVPLEEKALYHQGRIASGSNQEDWQTYHSHAQQIFSESNTARAPLYSANLYLDDKVEAYQSAANEIVRFFIQYKEREQTEKIQTHSFRGSDVSRLFYQTISRFLESGQYETLISTINERDNGINRYDKAILHDTVERIYDGIKATKSPIINLEYLKKQIPVFSRFRITTS